MNAYEVNKKYCERCIHKDKCYNLCPAVLRAIYLEVDDD